jgi:tRNA-specific 2-thiouridylase
MSGGTDSSVCAMLLQEQGFTVKGVTFITHRTDNQDTPTYVAEARQLAQQLHIEHQTLDISARFKTEIIDYFTAEYAAGRTPNPCIKCNETIKWAILYDLAKDLNCDRIATGHYANIATINNIHYITKGIDPSKDQSYFLWRLPQHILAKAMMPLGQFTKQQVKAMALERGFRAVSTKKESMGICFLAGSDVTSFLKKNLPPELQQAGVIIDRQGNTIGHHDGAPFYTIGQKRGLTLNEEAKGSCVHQIMPQQQTIVADTPEDLYCNHLTTNNLYFNRLSDIIEGKTYQLRIRGLDTVPSHPAKLQIKDNQLIINFKNPVWAITPGQSIVVYDENRVLGGAII